MQATLRALLCLALLAGASACSRPESTAITIEVGKVTRIDDCHVFLDGALLQEPGPITHLHYACGVAEAAQKEKEWWGNQPQPLAFSMYVGDCLLLKKTFYCMESIEPGASATLKPTYQVKHSNGDLIGRVR